MQLESSIPRLRYVPESYLSVAHSEDGVSRETHLEGTRWHRHCVGTQDFVTERVYFLSRYTPAAPGSLLVASGGGNAGVTTETAWYSPGAKKKVATAHER